MSDALITEDERAEPDRGLVFLLAVGAAVSVASLYYSQPILAVVAADLDVTPEAVGMLPVLNQLGYALGILLLSPLGDRYDRRRVILVKAALLTAALIVSAWAADIASLLGAGLATGVAATLAQDFVPAAATLAPPSGRGRIVGTVMTGLLLGILLSRLVSGSVAELFGWRAVYGMGAVSVALIAIASWMRLPRFRASTSLAYGALLASMAGMLRRHRALRRAALAQGLLAVAFSAFWSTLAIMLARPPLELGSTVAGVFGLAGAAGAVSASVAGRVADRRGPGSMTRVGAAASVLSFASLFAMPVLSVPLQLALLAVATIVFDLGVQASLVSHQSIVYGLDAAAPGRLNALLVTGVFVGMATGAALGALALSWGGWPGVVLLATLASLAALAVTCLPVAARDR